jgi:hypothetical protein
MTDETQTSEKIPTVADKALHAEVDAIKVDLKKPLNELSHENFLNKTSDKIGIHHLVLLIRELWHKTDTK